MESGTGSGLFLGGVDIAFVGTGGSVEYVDGGTGEAEDWEVGAGEFYASLADEGFFLAVFFKGGAFTEEEDTSWLGAD